MILYYGYSHCNTSDYHTRIALIIYTKMIILLPTPKYPTSLSLPSPPLYGDFKGEVSTQQADYQGP